MKDEDLLLNRKTNFPEIMSIAEAAAYLTISKYFLYTLVKGGFVPYAKIGKRIVFRQKERGLLHADAAYEVACRQIGRVFDRIKYENGESF